MTAIVWDATERLYETGVDRCVLYPDGVPWNGVTSIKENVMGGESVTQYFEGSPIAVVIREADFQFTIEAFTYPDEFDQYQGVSTYFDSQTHIPFGFTYRTINGSGHKIHIVYNALSAPSDGAWTTQDDAADITAFSWDVNSKPQNTPGAKMTSHLVIDTTIAVPDAVAAVEALLYGTVSVVPALPDIPTIKDLMNSYALLVVTDHGDGTFTMVGPDSAFVIPGDGTWTLNWPSASIISSDTFRVYTM